MVKPDTLKFMQTLGLRIALRLGFLLGLPSFLGLLPHAHAQDDWSLRGGRDRSKLILQRFQAIVEKSPSRGFAFQQMVKAARKDPGLDRLIASYRAKAKAQPNSLAFRLILAHLLLTTGQKKLASFQYQEVLRLDDKNLQAYSALADIYQEERAYAKSLDAFQTLCRLAKDPPTRRKCLRSQGTLYMLLKEPQKALEVWKAFLAASPQSSSAREEIAKSLTTAQLYNDALLQWQEILKRSGRGEAKARVFREIGSVYEQMGQWQDAVAVYRQALALTGPAHWMRRELDERILQLHRENGQLSSLIHHLQKDPKKTGAVWAMIARLLDETGRDKEAADAYKKALASNPKDSRLRVKYITLLEIQNNVDEAVQQSRLLVRLEPSEARYRMSFVELLSRMGKRKESLDEMAKLASAFSRNSEILMRLTTLYRRRLMQREANEILRKLIRLEPKEPSHRRSLGRFFFQTGDTKQALAAWQGILRSGMPAEAAHIALAQIYTEHEFYKEALASYKHATRLKPKHLPTQILLGEAYPRVIAQDPSASAKLLKEAILVWTQILLRSTRLPDRKKAMQQLFALHQQEGTLYRLPSTYEARLDKNPEDIEALRFLAELELWKAQRKRTTTLKASGLYEKILKIKPDDLDSLLMLEQLAAQQRNWHQAKRHLLRAIDSHKDGRRTYFRRMVTYNLKLGNYQEAISYGRKLIEINPDNASAHAELARIFLKIRDKIDDAIASYRTAVKLQPSNDSYKQALAGTLFTHSQLNEAAEIYRQLLKTSKEGSVIYEAALRLMEIFPSKKESSSLENDLQSLAEQNPRELSYFRALAELYRRQGRSKEAQIAYMKAAATVDQKHQVYKTLAEAARDQGDIKKAIIYFRKMLEETPDPSPEQTIQLAEMHFQVSETTPAQKILVGLLQEHPNAPRVLRQVSQLLDRHHLHDDAIQAYELFLDLEPEETSIRLRLAALYIQKAQPEAAAGLLEEILWQEKPRSVRISKPSAAPSPPARAVPYYLRSRYRYYRYRSRYASNGPFEQALKQLLPLYETMGRLDEWERRLSVRLTMLQPYQQANLILPLVRFYQERSWTVRLIPVLEALVKNDPNNPTWLQQLAHAYHLQGQNEKSLALFQRIDRPEHRNNYDLFLTRLRLLLSMKDRPRLKLILNDFLYSSLNNHYRLLQIVNQVEAAQEYDAAELLLSWGSRYATHSRETYRQRLVQLYINQSRHKDARTLLLAEWDNPAPQPHSNFYTLRNIREQLARSLWQVSSSQQQEDLVQGAERRVTELLLSGDKIRLRYALADAYVSLKLSRGEQEAQTYLPAIWGVADPKQDSYLRDSILSSLLRENQHEKALLLFQKEFAQKKTIHGKMNAVLHAISMFPAQTKASRPFMRAFEQTLRSLGSYPDTRLWTYAALRLADLYERWGDTKRVIWWLESCRWLDGHPDKYLRIEYLKVLARAYDTRGMKPQAQASYQRLFAASMSLFETNRFLAREQEALMQSLAHAFRLRRALGLRRYGSYGRRGSSYAIASHAMLGQYRVSWMNRYNDPFLRAQRLIADLSEVAEKVGAAPSLESFLLSKWKSAPDSSLRDFEFSLLLAFLHTRWKTLKTPASRDKLLSFLRDLHQNGSLKDNKASEFFLEASLEANHLSEALAFCKSSLLLAKDPAQQKRLLQFKALIYQKQGQDLEEKRIHLLLSAQHRDAPSTLWLARRSRSEGKADDAERFHHAFLALVGPSLHGHLYRLQRPLYNAHLLLATLEFLLPLRQHAQIHRLLKQAVMETRQHIQPSRYDHRNLLQRFIDLHAHLQQLPAFLASLEALRVQSPRDPHTLSLLSLGYQTLGQFDRQRPVLEDLVRSVPSEPTYLSSLLSLYRQEKSWAAAHAFLQSLSTLPQKRPLWHGFFLFKDGQIQEAQKRWKEEEQACETHPSPTEKIECFVGLGLMFFDIGQNDRASAFLHKVFSQKDAYSHVRLFRFREAAQHILRSRKDLASLRLLEPLFLLWYQEHKNHLTHEFFLAFSSLLELAQDTDPLGAYPRFLTLLAGCKTQQLYAKEHLFSLFLRHRLPLRAELLAWDLWQTFRLASSSPSKGFLCYLWSSRGLEPLCRALHPELSSSPFLRQDSLLAELQTKGHLYHAFLLLRLRWLHSSHSSTSLPLLASLAFRLGRHQEAKEFLALLQEKEPQHKEIPALQALLQSPSPATHPSLPFRLTSFPSLASTLRVHHGEILARQSPEPLSNHDLPRCSFRLLALQGLLVANDCKGRLIALDADSHQPRWSLSLASPKREILPYEPPYAASLASSYLAFSRIQRQDLFLRSNFEVHSLVEFDGDLVVVFSEGWLEWGLRWVSGVRHKLHLVRIDPKTAAIRWRASYDGEFSGSEVALHGSMLLVHGRHTLALDASSGRVLWSSGALGVASPWLIEVGSSLPPLSLPSGIFVSSGRSLLALSPQGQVLWKTFLSDAIQSWAGDPERLLLWTNNDELLALEPSSGKRLWSLPLEGGTFLRQQTVWPHFSLKQHIRAAPFFHNHVAYLQGADGFLSAVSLKEGRLLWRRFLGDPGFSSPQIDLEQKALVLLGNGGLLTFVDLERGTFLSRSRLFFQPPSLHAHLVTSPLVSDLKTWSVAFFRPSGEISLLSFPKRPSPDVFFKLASRLPKKEASKRSLFLSLASASPDKGREALFALLKSKQTSSTHLSLLLSSWLDIGIDLLSDLKLLSQHDLQTPFSLYPSYVPPNLLRELLAEQASYLLSLWRVRHQEKNVAFNSLKSFVLYRSGQFNHAPTTLTRRFLQAFLHDSSPRLRTYASIYLSVFRLPEARHALSALPLLPALMSASTPPLFPPVSPGLLRIPGRYQGAASPPSLQTAFFRSFIRWENSSSWQGLLLPRDAPSLEPFLLSPDLESRVLVACFFAQTFSSQPQTYPSLDSPRLRSVLFEGSQTENPELAIQAARALALLGDRRGVHALRSLLDRAPSHFRSRIARSLAYGFDDLSGSYYIDASSKNENQLNLVLPSFRLLQGLSFLRTEQWSSALASFQKVLLSSPSLLSPTHAEAALLGQGLVLLRLGRSSEAKLLLEKTSPPRPSSERKGLLGMILVSLGQKQEAIPLLAAALENPPESSIHTEALFSLSTLYAERGDLKKALALFDPLFQEDPFHHKAFSLRARVLLEAQRSDPHAALKDIQKALSLRSLHPPYLAIQAQILHALKRTKEAQAALQTALFEETPQTPLFKSYQALYLSLFGTPPPAPASSPSTRTVSSSR